MASLPSFTQQFHHQSYDAISPLRPELSARGRVVVVTGAAGMIGKATCRAFAQAGADYVGMLDMNDENLRLAKDDIERTLPDRNTVLEGFTADITSPNAIKDTFTAILAQRGQINVLVNNAGYQTSPATFRDSQLTEWWKSFEINVKGSFIVSQEFIRQIDFEGLGAGTEPVLINVSSILAHWGVKQGYLQGQSSYSASKSAMTRAMEILQNEEPRIRVVNVHPGLVASQMAATSGTLDFSKDNPDLPAHFCVWLASQEASFTGGCFLWVNWDVVELVNRRQEIIDKNLLRLAVEGVSADAPPSY